MAGIEELAGKIQAKEETEAKEFDEASKPIKPGTDFVSAILADKNESAAQIRGAITYKPQGDIFTMVATEDPAKHYEFFLRLSRPGGNIPFVATLNFVKGSEAVFPEAPNQDAEHISREMLSYIRRGIKSLYEEHEKRIKLAERIATAILPEVVQKRLEEFLGL